MTKEELVKLVLDNEKFERRRKEDVLIFHWDIAHNSSLKEAYKYNEEYKMWSQIEYTTTLEYM